MNGQGLCAGAYLFVLHKQAAQTIGTGAHDDRKPPVRLWRWLCPRCAGKPRRCCLRGGARRRLPDHRPGPLCEELRRARRKGLAGGFWFGLICTRRPGKTWQSR